MKYGDSRSVCLATGMFTSIALSLNRIVHSGSVYTGAFKVIILMNCGLSSGQGMLFLAVFGMDQIGRQLMDQIGRLVPPLKVHLAKSSQFWGRKMP